MGARFKTVDREQPFLMPPDLKEWLPANHIVHFTIEAATSATIRRCFWRSFYTAIATGFSPAAGSNGKDERGDEVGPSLSGFPTCVPRCELRRMS